MVLLHFLVGEEQIGGRSSYSVILLSRVCVPTKLAMLQVCGTYGFSANRTGQLKLIHGDIAVLGQQFFLLLLIGLLNRKSH